MYETLSREEAIDQLTRIDAAMRKIENEIRYFYRDSLDKRIEHAFAHHARQVENAAGHVQLFLTDLVVYLRAIALVADMVSHASTHSEKNARLRGLIEQIETAIQKVRESNFRFADDWYWSAPTDAFRSDYPTREYVQQLRDRDAEIKRLKIKCGEMDPEVIPASVSDDLPL